MANFSFLNAQDYANDVSGLFTLKEDGDTARVRILIDTPDDLRGVWTHWLQLNGRGRHVLCLADGECKDEKVYRQQCPICRFGKTSKEGKRNVKFFIPMLNLDTNEYVIWERGYNLAKNQSFLNLLSEYPKELYKQVVEIQRIGNANDYNTEYTFKALPESEVSYTRVDGDLSEFEIPNPVDSGLTLNKTYEELEYYFSNGHFEGDTPREDEGVAGYRRREQTSGDGYYNRRDNNYRGNDGPSRYDAEDDDEPTYYRGGNRRESYNQGSRYENNSGRRGYQGRPDSGSRRREF